MYLIPFNLSLITKFIFNIHMKSRLKSHKKIMQKSCRKSDFLEISAFHEIMRCMKSYLWKPKDFNDVC